MSRRAESSRPPREPPDQLDLQVARYLCHAADERGVGARTLANYRRDLSQFAAFIRSRGATSCASVTRLHLREWLSQLRSAGIPASTARRLALEARHLLRFAAGGADPDPFEGLNLPKAPRGAPAAISVDEMATLLAAPAEDTLGLRDRAVLAVLYATGLRVSQLVDLDCKQVDFTAAEIRRWDRSGHPRPAFLGPRALVALQRYLEESRPLLAGGGACPALFLSRLGHRLSARAVESLVARHARAVGLAASPRDLRVACALHLREGGARAGVVKRLLGTTLSTSRAPKPVKADIVS